MSRNAVLILILVGILAGGLGIIGLITVDRQPATVPIPVKAESAPMTQIAEVDALTAGLIEDATACFITSLQKRDQQVFRQLVSPSGLLVIRNFVSGGYGTRGKDIRHNYTVGEIPADLEFPVTGEIPVEPGDFLFPKLVKSQGKGQPATFVPG